MDPNTVKPSQGFTKVLNTGQLLRTIAVKACVGKRARDNAITRAALSQTHDNIMSQVMTSINYLQPASRLTSDEFYKTMLTVVLDWIANAPSGRDMNKRVEIHHHHHGSPMKPEAVQQQHRKTPRSSAENNVAAKQAAPQMASHVVSPNAKKKRIRVRFTTFALRDGTIAPWQCPYSEIDCVTCGTLWQRRYRCNKRNCSKQHQDGAHVDTNRAEEKFIRAQHPQFKNSGVPCTIPPSCGSSPSHSTPSTSVDAVVQQVEEVLDLHTDDSFCAEKRSFDWADEVELEEKRRKM